MVDARDKTTAFGYGFEAIPMKFFRGDDEWREGFPAASIGEIRQEFPGAFPCTGQWDDRTRRSYSLPSHSRLGLPSVTPIKPPAGRPFLDEAAQVISEYPLLPVFVVYQSGKAKTYMVPAPVPTRYCFPFTA